MALFGCKILSRGFLSTTAVRSISSLTNLENVKVVDEGSGVAHVQLNRPKSRNALTIGLWDDLKTAFDHLDTCSSCRAIVLSGNGLSFGVGIDLKEGITKIMDVAGDKSKDVSRKALALLNLINYIQKSFNSAYLCKKPVIAAIHGHCIGGTISLAALTDIRYAVKTTVFNIKEVDVGLAADVGVLNVISKITGNDSWCRELAFTARDFNGTEGVEKGFLSRAFDTQKECLDGALDLAKEIASKSPIAVQGSKLAMNYARDHTVQETFDYIKVWNSVHLQTEDMVKVAQAMMEKKKAVFNDA
ncbi:unnamed protein product [Bursaphelenchus xylophilus]|uniref:(pine wood nematode) hypothetical protein n=1 Tax=Bursaphelenchus xylophilus TaxID=6326 RepID=A0A7I8WQF8_BURXY|nr:unnamed protein product [Bursaphelenchus xylophilus]CAG9096689.1 unnamed protein product [Bursaphelenchus xylophilus]